MIRGHNFSGETTPRVVLPGSYTEYEDCNFSQLVPIEVDGKWQGVRLFPEDDTPRIFRKCNLVNCEPPPGSIVEGCNLTVKVFSTVSGTETVTIGGKSIVLTHHRDVIYGWFDPDTWSYNYLPKPYEIEVD